VFPSCETCYFWEPDSENDYGHCRRFPQAPDNDIVIFYAMNPDDDESPSVRAEIAANNPGFSVLPLTLVDDWCDEWEPF